MIAAYEKQELKLYSPKELEIIDYYHVNNMSRLKQICDPLISRKRIPRMDWDDLYDVASDTLLESLERFDDSKGCLFHTYLSGNIKRAFYDWTRDKHRRKRCNILCDSNGKIIRDENNNVTIIPDIPIDAPMEDGIDLCEKIASNFNLEKELTDKIGISGDSKIEKYLDRLSTKQRKVAICLSEGYKAPEIREILHITEKECSDCMMAIKSYKNIKILL